MSQREDLILILEQSRAKMIDQLETVNQPEHVNETWTTRELLAHLSGWDDVAIAYLQSLMAGQIPPILAENGIDQYNAESVARRMGIKYDDVLLEYTQKRKLFIDLVWVIPEAEITGECILPWGESGTLVDIVNIWGAHEVEHAEELQKYRSS